MGMPSAPGNVPKYESNERFSCMTTITCLIFSIPPAPPVPAPEPPPPAAVVELDPTTWEELCTHPDAITTPPPTTTAKGRAHLPDGAEPGRRREPRLPMRTGPDITGRRRDGGRRAG